MPATDVAGKRMGALSFDWHLEEFERIRKSEGMVAYLHGMGEQLVEQLNAELHAAQQARNQPVADGYKYYVTNEGDASRARLHVLAFTARGQAHEAAHQSILRMLGEATATTAAVRKRARTAQRRFNK